MKKVIALHASRRKMNTYGLLVQIRELLKEQDAEVEIVPLYDLELKDCLGCEQCIRRDRCALDDGAEELMEKLSGADGIILSSPVYLQQVSGKMKSFIDRTCRWFHRPALAGKPVLCVATTKGSGLKLTLDYLENVAMQWGGMPAGRVGRSVRNADRPVKASELKRFAELLKDPAKYRPPLTALMDFEVQKVLAGRLEGLDGQFWEEKGWNPLPYYFPCRVGALQGGATRLVGDVIRKKVAGVKRPENSDAANP